MTTFGTTKSAGGKLGQVLCCISTATQSVVEGSALTLDRGGVTHKGPDLECNDSSLWVWFDRSSLVDDSDLCHQVRERVFNVILAFPTCTERADPCGTKEYGCFGTDAGCLEPDPKLGTGRDCTDGSVTVKQEADAVYELIDLLESGMTCKLAACLEECGAIRCAAGTLSLGNTTLVTEGAQTRIEMEVAVTW